MAEITIKSVEGNPLNINVVMTAVEHSMLNGEIVTETVDFYPDTTKPVRAYLDCTTARKQFCPTTYVDGNIVYLSCDNATAGVYTLTVTCTDTNGKARRYKSDACIEVYDLTSAAEIAGTFDEQTYEMNGVFYTFGGGGATVQSDWDESNPESPAYIRNKPNLSDYATDEELQAVADTFNDSAAAQITDGDIENWNNKSDFSGSYNDLSDKPTIPPAQVQSDWNQTNTSAKDYIKNKPTIPQGVVVDSSLSSTSENPVQNKAVKSALDLKANQATTYSKTEVDTKLSDCLLKKAQTLSIDEQDIVSANLFNKASGNGMGRVVLKKNQPFASQVTQANTIYEIKYDFDLNNFEVLPEGSQLYFNGGSLNINGTKIIQTEIDALHAGIIPNIASFADYNAEKITQVINSGFSLIVNQTYYIGTAGSSINHNIKIHGCGKFIKTSNAASFTVSSPITIEFIGISLIRDVPTNVSETVQFINIPVQTHIYNPLVVFENCTIDNVRVYTHVADDVDQVTIKDGVEKFIFKNNIVKNIGYYCVRLGDCLSDYVEISNNSINKFCTCVFDLGVNNDYQLLSFPRIKNVIIHSNYIDNSGYILTDETYNSYHTPFIVEAGFCSFNNNTIKNILCESNAAVAVYAAYLSADKLEMRNNYIYNVINLANSTYNECFKAKGSTGGAYERIICCNTYIISEDVLNEYSPSIKFFSLQTVGSNECNILNISNNFVDVSGCTFTWGAGTNIVYHNATISHNIISCKEVGVVACEMFRLADNTALDGNIRIIGNRMSVKESPTQTASLIREAEGYSIYIEDNDLCNCIPYGSFNTNYTNLEIISKRNHFIQPGLTKVYHATSVDDEIVFPKTNNGVTVYLDLLQDSYISFYLPSNSCFFNLDWSGTNSIGLYKFTISCGLGESSVYCRADENTVLLINDAGKVITCPRTTTDTQQIIGLSLSQTISLGAIKVTGKDVVFEVLQYARSFKPKCTIEKYATIPNVNAFGNKNLLSEASGADNNLRPYLVWKNNRIGYVQNGKMYNANGLHDGALSGTTSERPTSSLGSGDKGFQYFDTTLGKPIYWTGTAWVDATGATV